MTRQLVLIGLALCAVAGCGEKIDAVQEGPCQLTDTVTYTAQIQAIFEEHCTSCHAATLAGTARNGAPASVNLDSSDAATAVAEDAVARARNGSMPPGTSTVSAAQRELLSCWVEQGKQEQ